MEVFAKDNVFGWCGKSEWIEIDINKLNEEEKRIVDAVGVWNGKVISHVDVMRYERVKFGAQWVRELYVSVAFEDLSSRHCLFEKFIKDFGVSSDDLPWILSKCVERDEKDLLPEEM